MREKLIEILRQTRYEYRRYIGMKDMEKRMAKTEEEFLAIDDSILGEIPFCADYLLSNGVTVQEWIPVTERLPEDTLPRFSEVKQIKVLTALKSDKGVRTVRSQMRYRDSWANEVRWRWKYSGSEITHWMPLPEPPKGERRTDE